MEKQPAFLIYDAAAGSGKTFTLVKEYLKQILSANTDDYYKHLLAITFTNKAVAEMKQRIVATLVNFSENESVENPLPIMLKIVEEIGMDLGTIQTRSQRILKNLLHNYAAFSVETIDRFNHRLIRTFARDLKLATNFEVTLDTNELLAEAVDLLLSKAGENKEVTKVLLDFALEKTDDDKSWDISKDIAKAAKLLYNENEATHVKGLKEKSLEDFLLFKSQILKTKHKISETVKTIASEALQLIEESGLQYDDFSSSYLPKYFLKLADGHLSVNFGLKWQDTMDEKPLYPGRVSAAIKATIDQLTPIFSEKFQFTKQAVTKIWLLDAILKNLNPLSVINLVNQEIENIKIEKNIFPISEFNALINKEIKNQPAPFIYERMGEKYRHFFIDEFQDTSKLQWENLIPLIDNALSQQEQQSQGSLLLVGDAKQSIYRWRGGLPEQFIELYGDKKKPFSIQDKKVAHLPKNFRSCKEIVTFNNNFFSFIANYFSDEEHTSLYEKGNKQHLNDKQDGYVKLEFIEKQNKADNQEVYSKLVYDAILDAKNKGFSESDICILTRRKADGVVLGTYLMEKEIQVISQETLLLQSSALVQILVLSLTVSLYSNNEEAKINLLDLLHDFHAFSEEKHTFFMKSLNASLENFSSTLKEFGLDFDFKEMQKVSLYEGFEYCIQQLKLAEAADAYLFGFMDLVYEFELQPLADKVAFIDTWETKKESASIAAAEGTNAVQLMTIHKAKGLEFPIVIFPFADIELYKTQGDTLWYPLDEAEFNFDEAQVNYNSALAEFSEIGAAMYQNHRSQLELDNINLLYVTLTRAVEKLYIFAEMPTEPKSGIPVSYNHLFMEFLKHKSKWNSDQMIYEFGKNGDKISKEKIIPFQRIPIYESSNPKEHNLRIVSKEALLWETETEIAITAGNILHDTMAQIFTKEDAEKVLEDLEKRAILTKEELTVLKQNVLQIIQHPELIKLFDGSSKVYNERDIITANGLMLRPDRINIQTDNSVIIVDYKTGSQSEKHKSQLASYAQALKEMGFKIQDSILIYCSDSIVLWQSSKS